MTKLTLKQKATAEYLKVCNVMDVKPENYKRWTVANLQDATDELRASYVRQHRTAQIDSVKANTKAVVETVMQKVGEPISVVRDRARALAKLTGKAIPFKLIRK